MFFEGAREQAEKDFTANDRDAQVREQIMVGHSL